MARVADPERHALPRPDVWFGVCFRDGEYVGVMCESRDGVDLSRWEIISDDGLLSPVWEAVYKAVRDRWDKERYGR